MPPTKKIAFMISGHFRQFDDVKIKFWKDFVAKHSATVDIYVHTWNEPGTRVATDKAPDFALIRRLLKPSVMKVEEHAPLYESFSFLQKNIKLYYAEITQLRDDINPDFSRNIGSQLYSIMKCWELVRDSGKKYDFLVRLRADCILLNFENFINKSTEWITNNTLVVNSGVTHRHHGGGGGCDSCGKEFPSRKRIHTEHTRDICDVFALGRPLVMEKLCKMYLHRKGIVASFTKYNEHAITLPEVKEALVVHKNTTGVRFPKIYEFKIKCFYPERLIREYMKEEWVVSDPMGLIPKVIRLD